VAKRKVTVTYTKPRPDESDLDWLARFILKKMRKEGIIGNVSP